MNAERARIPYENRSHWMADRHYQYGNKCHLHDVDYIISPEENRTIWMEHMGQQGIALAEFKNANETIELYKYGQLVWLADGREIPAYIVVGAQDPFVYYYLIPLNETCKKILGQPRYCSERNYIRFLHYLRKIEPKEEALQSFSNHLPDKKFTPKIKERAATK